MTNYLRCPCLAVSPHHHNNPTFCSNCCSRWRMVFYTGSASHVVLSDRMSAAISDIWLGIRTVPVLSVAKESRGASQIAHWPRSARTQAGRCGLTDRRSSGKKLLSFVRLLMFPSLPEEFTGHGMPVECSKLTCFAKVKNRHGSRAVRSTIAVGRCQSSFAYCEAEPVRLGKGEK